MVLIINLTKAMLYIVVITITIRTDLQQHKY